MDYSLLIALLFNAYYKGYTNAKLNLDNIDLNKALRKQFAMASTIGDRIGELSEDEYKAVIDFIKFC